MNRAAGLTLIELMIVIAIIAFTVTMAMPYLSNRNAQTRAFLREMVVLSRELHTKAKLHGVTYRLVIEIVPGKTVNDPGGGRFWVEKSNAKVVLNEKEEEAAKEREEETDEAKKKDPRGFDVDTGIIKSPRELPTGLRFDKIELTRVKNPITSGKAYIHYMPQGLVDEAAIHIRGEKEQSWTIAIHPLTGRAELVGKPLSLKEIKNQ
jgi:general secretion pathway protein H